MYCTRCGTLRSDNAAFCTQCGQAFPTKKIKKGSRWVPIVLLTVMMTIGTVVYFLHPEESPVALTEAPWFRTLDGEVSFYETLYNGSSELTVPQGVTALSDNCFYDCDGLEAVLLPESLVTVGDWAFAECDSLRGVKLSEGVTVIGRGAFENCPELEAVTIPATVESIGDGAFVGCGALRHIFFEGSKTQWIALYSGEFGTETTIYCVDGDLSAADIGG